MQVDFETAVISSIKIIAKYKGLTFKIVYKDETHTQIRYSELSGSLHKFNNSGKHNYNDFTFMQLLEVVNVLKTDFYIEPQTAYLSNLEFGVNIYLLFSVSELLLNLVAYKNKDFKTLSNGRKRIGKQIVNQKHRNKIYDKGKQANLKVKNLARFEMHYNKMAELKKYGIVTLQDLTDIHKISPLVNELLSFWDNIIYYDKSINLKNLSPTQQKRVLYSAVPRNWFDFNRMQRMRAKSRFNELMSLHGSTSQKDISNLIANKWQELTAEKCIRFTQHKKQLSQTKSVYVLPVSMYGYNVTKTPLKSTPQITLKKPHKKTAILLPIITTKKSPSKKRKCKTCKTDISHKKQYAKYCNKKCNNKHNGMKRTATRKKRILQEKTDLKKLLLILRKRDFDLCITYEEDSNLYTDFLTSKEIQTVKEWINKIQKVLITKYRKNAPPVILNSYRARKLISEINKKND
ncbi:hypothetical protein [Tenacibaculum insulae]|uniref:hypothetical protein n=1 Tax=Tenacibaculum insulae TaxID=2029677 RepID=UPI003AB4132C